MGRPAIWLVVLLLGWTATTALWIQREAAPPLWDQADYLQRSEVIAAHLRAGELGLLLDVLLHTGARSSFVALLPQAFYALLGHSPRTALLVNLVAMPVLLGSVYAMARHLLGPAAGILAAFFTAMSPLVFGLSRQFLTDFPLATAVALSYALLFASAYLTRSGWTWCLGVVLAAGLLLKVTFPLFVAGGLGLVVAIRLLAGPASRQLLPLDLFRLTLPVLVVAGPWYIVNLRGILWFSEYAAFGSAAQYYGLGPVLAPSTIWRYSGMLGLQAFSPLLVLLGVALVAAAALGGAWRYLLRRLRAPEPLAVALWGGLPLLALTLSYNKDMRYLLPAIPAFAVGLAALVQAQPRWVGGALLSLLTPALVVQFLLLSFVPSEALARSRLLAATLLPVRSLYTQPPRPEAWPVEQVVATVAGQEPMPGAVVALLANHGALHPNLLNYVAWQQGYRHLWFYACNHHSPTYSLRECLTAIASADLVLAKTGDAGPAYATRFSPEIRRLLDQGSLPFRRLPQTIRLPDGSEILLYQATGPRRPAPLDGLPGTGGR
ncbi:MAG: glycosyltransferase family 39 protein [Deltaproteobacteria bacterium]|nr:glycosyltransferase family 39 protein [Deltaproteobacteria bacterium]